jgi:hypothetical protein
LAGEEDSVNDVKACVPHYERKVSSLIKEIYNLRAENAQLKRDAACFAALYEMAQLRLGYRDWISRDEQVACREWKIMFWDYSDPKDPAKDIERFRKAIEAQVPA